MNGQMKRYKRYRDSLSEMSAPIMPSQIKGSVDIQGLLKESKRRGVKVTEMDKSVVDKYVTY
jgi:hypothetical protein